MICLLFLRRIFLNALFKLLEAVCPLLDELLVVKSLVYNDVQETESERSVRSRAQLQPFLGARRRPCKARVYRDYLRAALHQVYYPVAREIMVGALAAASAAAPYYHYLRRSILRVVITLRQKLRRILEGDIAADHVHTGKPRRKA